MTLHADYTLVEVNEITDQTGRYCSICDETWHEPYAHKTGIFWHIPASDGNYRLVYNGVCGCQGYFHRGNCRHAALATGLERQGKKHDLTHSTWVRYEQERLPWDYPEDPTLDDIRGSIG